MFRKPFAQKYANLGTAHYQLEMLVAGTAGSSLLQENQPRLHNPMEGVMDDLMESSRQAYRQLLEADGFIDFFREATPIDVIESSRIGAEAFLLPEGILHRARAGLLFIESYRDLPLLSWPRRLIDSFVELEQSMLL